MPFIPALKTVRISLEFTLNGKVCVNVIYANKTTTIVSADLVEIAETVRDWWIAHIKPIASADLSLQSVVTRDMTTEAGEQRILTDGLPSVGSVADGAMPNNVALVASLRTGIVGRSFRGRVFNLGLAESQVNQNLVDTTTQAAWLAAYDQLHTDLEAIDASWVVASFRHSGAPRVTATLTPINEVIVNRRVDTQRKRLPD